jgi:Calcineurin-like phosphoesterase
VGFVYGVVTSKGKHASSIVPLSSSYIYEQLPPYHSLIRIHPVPMAQLNFQIISDLHMELPAAYSIFEIEPKAPYLALLGDIGYVKDAGFFDFLRKQLRAFQLVFLVLGNHEPYHSSWTDAISEVMRFQAESQAAFARGETSGQLILLNRTRYDLSPSVTILGCTLFSRVTEAQTEMVSFGLNDFYYIKDWTIETHREAHLADLAWLNGEIDSISRSEPERSIVVLTHYCPLTDDKVVDPKHRDSKISSGFMSDLSSEPCWTREAVKLWAFGHTHFNSDFVDPPSGKRVLSNQMGYYFAQSDGFDVAKVVGV